MSDEVPDNIAPTDAEVQGFLDSIGTVKSDMRSTLKEDKQREKLAKQVKTTKATLIPRIQELQEAAGVSVNTAASLRHKSKAQLVQLCADLMEKGKDNIEKREAEALESAASASDASDASQSEEGEEGSVVVGIEAGPEEMDAEFDADDGQDEPTWGERRRTVRFGQPRAPMSERAMAAGLFNLNLTFARLVSGIVEANSDTLGVSVLAYPEELMKDRQELEELYLIIYREHADALQAVLRPEMQIMMYNIKAAGAAVRRPPLA
jgi:hypothetical protein